MCKSPPIGALMVGLFICGNMTSLFGILIWNQIIDITEGEMAYAKHSDVTSIPKLRATQHTAGNLCSYYNVYLIY